jgi:thiol-disulfide isomerase/thioredoxin
VLNFWGVWCPPCVRELPDLDAARKSARMASTGARFVAVNSGIGGATEAAITHALVSHPVDLPVAFDLDQTVYRAFGIHGLPTTIIVVPHGAIRLVRVGFASTADFKAWLEENVAELSGA